jgi:hypothetical protein
MKLELDVYSTICETRIFKINGIKATFKDFGEKYDTQPDQVKLNICGNMAFKPMEPTQRVLDKYGINVSEYKYVCEKLRACVSFGTCRLCG